MELLVIRHAIAVDREVYARDHADDDKRPLTKEGMSKMRDAADGLVRVAPSIATLAASPLLRAQQTADILAEALEPKERVELEELRPGEKPSKLVHWLRARKASTPVAIVGHEPHLGLVISWLCASSESSFVELKKGGACLLEFTGDIRAGAAMLRWCLTPGQLRRIAR
jgi:phosphohistidine phosphatase